MSSPLPVGLLNVLKVSGSPAAGAADKDKDVGDGFQALLDIGLDKDPEPYTPKGKPAPKNTQDGRDVAASYVEAPSDVVVNDKPDQSDYAEYEEDIEVYVRKDTKDRSARAENDEVAPDSRPATQATDKKNLENAEETAAASSVGNDEEKNEKVTAIIRLLKASGIELPQFSQSNGVAGKLEETLAELSPELLQRLQSILQNIQAAVQNLDTGVTGKEKSEITSLFGQLVATLNKPDTDEVKIANVETLLGKLQAFSDLVSAKAANPATNFVGDTPEDAAAITKADAGSNTAVSELSADNDNKNANALSKVTNPVALAALAKNADENAPGQIQQNSSKPEGAPGAAVSNQIAARADSGSSGSGFSDNKGGNDNSQLMFGIARANPQAASSTQAGNASFSRILQQTTPQPVLEQVVFHVKSAVESGGSKIHIQLHPAELGKLDIKLEVDADGKTGITVTADNKNTLDLLQRDSRGLERALADAGLKADSGSLSFNLRGGEQEKGNDQAPSQAYRQPQLEEEPLALDLLTKSYVVNLSEGLDIKI